MSKLIKLFLALIFNQISSTMAQKIWRVSTTHQILIKAKHPIFYKYTDCLSSIGDIKCRSHKEDCQLPMIFKFLYYLNYHKCKKLNLHYRYEIKEIKITKESY